MTRRHRHHHARALFSIKKRGGGWRKFMNFNSGPGQPEQQAAVMCRMIFNKLPASVATGVREICTAHGNVELSWWNNEESARPPERERESPSTHSLARAGSSPNCGHTNSLTQSASARACGIDKTAAKREEARPPPPNEPNETPLPPSQEWENDFAPA